MPDEPVYNHVGWTGRTGVVFHRAAKKKRRTECGLTFPGGATWVTADDVCLFGKLCARCSRVVT